MKKLKYILFISLVILVSCKGKEGGGGDGGVDPPPPVPAPTAATLNTPAKNSECLDGENVEFKWAASDNTDSYDITVSSNASSSGDGGGTAVVATQNKLYDLLNLLRLKIKLHKKLKILLCISYKQVKKLGRKLVLKNVNQKEKFSLDEERLHHPFL